MSRPDISYAQSQMDKHRNIIVGFPHPVPIGFITNPEEGINSCDGALGPLVVIAESDEKEYAVRAREFGLGDIRDAFPEVFYYLAAAE